MEDKDAILTPGEVAVMSEMLAKKNSLGNQLQLVDSWMSEIANQILARRNVSPQEYMIGIPDWKVVPIKNGVK